MVARLSDLDYSHLYSRYRTCTACGCDYEARAGPLPGCRAIFSTLADRSGRPPAMVTLTNPRGWLTVAPNR